MEFFGLTSYGFSSPIKDMLRDDYEEPTTPPSNFLENKEDQRTFSEKIKELDCVIGCANGYAYGSLDRIIRMRNKHLFKPVGPTDMYKYPGTNSMNCGWWTNDPALKGLPPRDNWFQPRVVHSITTSEMSRFVTHCLTIDKYFKL